MVVIGLMTAISSIFSRLRRGHLRSLLTLDRIVSYAREQGYSYRARMHNCSKSFGFENTPPADSQRDKRSMNNGSSPRPSDRMVIFLEPSSTNSQDRDGLYHLEHPNYKTIDDEYQPEESATTCSPSTTPTVII